MMVKAQEKILDDIAQLAGGAAGLASGLSRHFRDDMRSRMEELVLKMDFVPRSEFERLEMLYKELSKKHDDLLKRIRTLEKAKKK